MKAKGNLVIFVFTVYSSAFLVNFEQILCIVSVSLLFLNKFYTWLFLNFEQILHIPLIFFVSSEQIPYIVLVSSLLAVTKLHFSFLFMSLFVNFDEEISLFFLKDLLPSCKKVFS